MIPIWLALFFLFSSVAVWVLFFEDVRALVFRGVRKVYRAIADALGMGRTRLSAGLGNAAAKARGEGGRVLGGLWAHRGIVAATAALLLLPVSLVLVLRQNVTLEGFETTQRQHDSVLVQELLRGERLIPPSAPPPEVFMTREVEIVRPMTATADRKWENLDAEFTQALLAVYVVMKERHGYEMVLVEGYRSPARQNQLAARGRHVTRATAGRSWHQYGLAADSAFMRDGRLVISERDPWAMRGYQLYGEVAKEAGLVWGGDWRSIKDLMHVELRRPGVMPH